MKLLNKRVGFVITGSFCTFKKTFNILNDLVLEGADVQTVFSFSSKSINSRFGKTEDFLKQALEITKNTPITSIEDAEPFGPKKLCDIMVIAPATGNTIAKLANGITDTPALMAAKAHLRNQRPLVIAVSTNDALAMNFKNIGLLLNAKNIYFVPFKQDSPKEKPNSLVADFDKLIETLEYALENKQNQPIIAS